MAQHTSFLLAHTAAESASTSSGGTFRRLLLILLGFAAGALMCAMLFIGSAFYFADDDLRQLAVELLVSPTPTATITLGSTVSATVMPTVSVTLEPTTTLTMTRAVISPTITATPQETLTETVTVPQFSLITFARDATAEEYQPIDPGIEFTEGITEIHAIFDYQGMSRFFTWERIWYLNGVELLRNAAPWSGDQAGRFDYFVDADGNPLPEGVWLLELYVENKLMVTGTFVITPVAAPLTPTSVPTASPAPSVAPPQLEAETLGAETVTPTTAVAEGTPLPPSEGVFNLAYTKWDGGQHDLYVADTNGQGEHFLLHRAAGPSWTPDGQQLFFYGEAGVDQQRLVDGREFFFPEISNGIVAMTNAVARPDMPDVRLFQDVTWKYGSARWANVSPDGQMVAFDASPGGGSYRIFFLGTAANAQFQFEILGEQADWAPDSQRVVYRSGRDGITGLWISVRNDTAHRLLTNVGTDSFPAWSPDGQSIAFSRDESNNVEIFTINVEGTDLRRLTDSPGPDTLPTYAPNGDIIFRTVRSGRWAIWKMRPDGTDSVEIIADAPVGPDWTYSRMDAQ